MREWVQTKDPANIITHNIHHHAYLSSLEKEKKLKPFLKISSTNISCLNLQTEHVNVLLIGCRLRLINASINYAM